MIRPLTEDDFYDERIHVELEHMFPGISQEQVVETVREVPHSAGVTDGNGGLCIFVYMTDVSRSVRPFSYPASHLQLLTPHDAPLEQLAPLLAGGYRRLAQRVPGVAASPVFARQSSDKLTRWQTAILPNATITGRIIWYERGALFEVDLRGWERSHGR